MHFGAGVSIDVLFFLLYTYENSEVVLAPQAPAKQR